MSQPKVLIVDDAQFIRDHVTRIVKHNFPDYQIDAAVDGDDGRRMMSQEIYDLVLCDWEMPGMSGLELLQWARAKNNYRDIPFVMVTSRGERDYVLQAIKAGVNDYLSKPFEDTQLVEKIRKFVGRRIEASSEARRRAAQMLAAGETAAKAKKTTTKPKGLAQLRAGSALLKCAIQDITLQSIKVIIKREGGIPQLLEHVVVDIDGGGQTLVQLNGFINALAANSPDIETHFISVDVLFTDNDPAKMELLTRYIAKQSSQKE